MMAKWMVAHYWPHGGHGQSPSPLRVTVILATNDQGTHAGFSMCVFLDTAQSEDPFRIGSGPGGHASQSNYLRWTPIKPLFLLMPQSSQSN
jgi:hypothetical protein